LVTPPHAVTLYQAKKVDMNIKQAALNNNATNILTRYRMLLLRLAACMLAFFSFERAAAQQKNQMVRLAKIQVDSAQLDSYKAFLKEEIETSVRVEPGVITLYAVSEKDNPTHITILEIYADSTAYKAHIQTPHFIKYKTGTAQMVKHLELVAVDALMPGMKIK
jgi:quinol monooxygenase YgiN